MSNKIPCGGFKLDNNFFGMNENDELSLTGGSEGEGKAYQYLVTDGNGTAKWEDRLAYYIEDSVVEYDGIADGKETMDFGGKTVVLVKKVPGLMPRNFIGSMLKIDGSTYIIKESDITIKNQAEPCVFLVKNAILVNEWVGLFVPSTMGACTIMYVSSYKALSPYYSGICGLVITRNSAGEYSANVGYHTLFNCFVGGVPIWGSIYDRQNNFYFGHIDRVAFDDSARNIRIDIYSHAENSLTQLIYSEDGTITESGSKPS